MTRRLLTVAATAGSWLVIAAFTATLLLGLLVPMYTDEVAAKMQLSRTLIEGGRMVTLFPQCAASFAQPLPLAHYPAAALYHVVFGGLGLLGLRVSSLAVLLVTLPALWVVLKRVQRERGNVLPRFASAVSMLALGTIPLAFVTARVEPVLVLALALYVVFPFAWPISSCRTRASRALVTCAFVVLTSVFFFSHLKALLYTPFVVVSLALTFGRRRVAWLLIASACVALVALQTYGTAKQVTSCPESPAVMGVLRGLSLSPGDALRAPLAFGRAGGQNLVRHAAEISDQMALEPNGYRWLPPSQTTARPIASAFDRATRIALVALYAGLPAFVLLASLAGVRRPRHRRRAVLALLLASSTFAHALLANFWAYYNHPFVIATYVLAAFVAPPLLERRGLRTLSALAGFGLKTFALASLVVLVAHVGPRLVALAKAPGTTLPDQPAFVPVFGYGEERAKIRAHAATCGIVGDGSRHLVIDDATLFAFDHLHEPLHVLYVSDAALWGADFPGAKDVALLGGLDAPGIISRCAYFPTALVTKARRAGDYCCVPRADLHPAP